MNESDFMSVLKVAADCDLTCKELYKSLDDLTKAGISGQKAGEQLRKAMEKIQNENI